MVKAKIPSYYSKIKLSEKTQKIKFSEKIWFWWLVISSNMFCVFFLLRSKTETLTVVFAEANCLGSFISCVYKIFLKTNISYPLIHICRCTYQGVKNFSFSKDFQYVLINDPYSVRESLKSFPLCKHFRRKYAKFACVLSFLLWKKVAMLYLKSIR